MEYYHFRIPSSSWAFKENADNFFRPFMRYSPEIQSNAAIDFIYRYTEVLFITEGNLKVLQNILLDIIATFEDDSSRMLNRILKLYVDIADFIRSYHKSSANFSVTDRRSQERIEAIGGILDNINKVYAQPMKSRHIFQIINSGNIFVMKVLSRNGLLHHLQDDWLSEALQELRSLEEFLEIPRHSPRGDSGSQFVSGRQFPLSAGFFAIFRDQDRIRRNLLALMAVYALRSGDRRRAEGHAECVRLFFSTIPDDFVTLQELNDVLVQIYEGQRAADFTVPVFMARLEELYPESRRPREPRSLLPLCRVSINSRILESGGTLTSAISDLKIPQPMKN